MMHIARSLNLVRYYGLDVLERSDDVDGRWTLKDDGYDDTCGKFSLSMPPCLTFVT
jgi:hypothetical protein